MTQELQSTIVEEVVQTIVENGLEGMAQAFSILLNEAMKVERSRALGAEAYERSPERQGYANGYKPRRLTTRIGELELQLPQVRGEVEFYPSALERGQRSERALKLAVAEMYVQGVSTRKVNAVMQRLCGCEVTATEVSRAAKRLDDELQKWRERPLGETPYLVLDARYEHVRCDGAVVSCAVLVALGVRADGRRSVLGVSVSLSEAEVHWREFILSLKRRGLHGVRMVTSDDHAGLKAALKAALPGTPWQRCQVHLQRNAAAYVPKSHLRPELARDLRNVFNAPGREDADRLLALLIEKYQPKAAKLAAWLADNVPEGFNVFSLPPAHRLRLRSTNSLENLNRQMKRRTRVASLFPNEASLLRLVSAVLMETSDEWETQKRYLTFNHD